MRVESLQVHDFRSYRSADVVFHPGVNLLLGANGHGKTNLLEAVHRAATGGSHRVAGDAALVRVGQEHGVVRVAFVTDAGTARRLELEVGTNRRSRLRLDGQGVRRAADAVGVLRVVVFAPEDLQIVRGTPSGRRDFLDGILAQRRPLFAATASEYERVLRQRGALLKELRRDRSAAATLQIWDEELVRVGSALLAARIAAVHALAGPVARAYGSVADRPSDVVLRYASSTGVEVVGDETLGVPPVDGLAEQLRAAIEDRRDEELARGVTLIGPHRDDLVVELDGMPARTHASQGEAWALALALRLGSHDLLTTAGDRPVVLLDDVFSELDATRRRRLAEACAVFEQVLVTAAVEADVPLTGHVLEVARSDAGDSTVVAREDVVAPSERPVIP